MKRRNPYPVGNIMQSNLHSFGMLMKERTFSSEHYRYGFNSQEKDDEISGEGNTIAFEARIYDSRLGRFLSHDPLEFKYPRQSTYVFAANNSIALLDHLGMGTIAADETITQNKKDQEETQSNSTTDNPSIPSLNPTNPKFIGPNLPSLEPNAKDINTPCPSEPAKNIYNPGLYESLHFSKFTLVPFDEKMPAPANFQADVNVSIYKNAIFDKDLKPIADQYQLVISATTFNTAVDGEVKSFGSAYLILDGINQPSQGLQVNGPVLTEKENNYVGETSLNLPNQGTVKAHFVISFLIVNDMGRYYPATFEKTITIPSY